MCLNGQGSSETARGRKIYCHLLGMLLVYINNLLHLIVAAHENTRSIVDTLGNNSQHALHATVHCLAASWDKNKLVARAQLPTSNVQAKRASLKRKNWAFFQFLEESR